MFLKCLVHLLINSDIFSSLMVFKVLAYILSFFTVVFSSSMLLVPLVWKSKDICRKETVQDMGWLGEKLLGPILIGGAIK